MKKRILLISLGSIGKRHLRNARSLMPDAEIAVHRQYTKSDDKIPEGADKLLRSLNEAKDYKPHAVLISSPASEHIENAITFLDQSAHLFIEKPLAVDTKNLNSFTKKCEQANTFVMIGYVLRFLPLLNSIKAYLDSNELGRIYTAHVQVGQYLPDWRPESDYRNGVSAQKKLGGGALLELSHEIDYTNWLFGTPNSLICSTNKISNLEIDVEDNASLIFEYDEPAKKIMIQLDFLQRVAKMGLQVVGEKGTLEADLIKEKAYLYTPQNPDGTKLNMNASQDGNEPYMRQFDLFFSKAFEDYKPVFSETNTLNNWSTPQDAVKIMQLVDAAKKSNAQGVRVKVKND